MKHYHAPELEFELLQVRDVLTASGVGPTTSTDPTKATDPTRVTDPTAGPTEATSAGGGIVLPEDTFG